MNINKNLRISLFEGIISAVHFGIVNGVYITAFATKIGADARAVAFMSSLFNISFIFSFLTIFLLFFYRKPMMLAGITGFISRSIWIIFFFEKFWNLKILFSVILIANIFLNISGTSWAYWFSNILKSYNSKRGEYMGIRLGLITFSQTLSFLLIAFIFEKFGFKVLFLICFLLSLSSFILYLFQDDFEIKGKYDLKNYLKEAFNDKSFKEFARYLFAFNFLLGITAPMFGYYAVKYMKLTNLELGLWIVSMGIGSTLFQTFWGKILDKISSITLLKINLFYISIIPIIWIIRPYWMWYFIYIDGFFGSIGWAAINLAHSYINLMIIKNPIYQVLFSLIGGIGAFLGNNAGGLLVKLFKNEEFGIKFSFFLSFIFRILLGIYLPRFQMKKIMSTKEAVKYIFKYILDKMTIR
ncbi:MAG: MFS transporter [candidate division WOR-3 bacterium]